MNILSQMNSIELKIVSDKFIRTRNFLFLSFDRTYDLKGVTSIHFVRGELSFHLGLVYSNTGYTIVEITDWKIDERINEVFTIFQNAYNIEEIVDNGLPLYMWTQVLKQLSQ